MLILHMKRKRNVVFLVLPPVVYTHIHTQTHAIREEYEIGLLGEVLNYPVSNFADVICEFLLQVSFVSLVFLKLVKNRVDLINIFFFERGKNTLYTIYIYLFYDHALREINRFFVLIRLRVYVRE